MKTLILHHLANADRSPVGTVYEVLRGEFRTEDGWTPDPAEAKRHPLRALPTNRGEYCLVLPGDWPPGVYLVAVYEMPGDTIAYSSTRAEIFDPEPPATAPGPTPTTLTLAGEVDLNTRRITGTATPAGPNGPKPAPPEIDRS